MKSRIYQNSASQPSLPMRPALVLSVTRGLVATKLHYFSSSRRALSFLSRYATPTKFDRPPSGGVSSVPMTLTSLEALANEQLQNASVQAQFYKVRGISSTWRVSAVRGVFSSVFSPFRVDFSVPCFHVMSEFLCRPGFE